MPGQRPPYWFDAKEFGWGWGWPARREGWAVYIIWLILVLGISPPLALNSLPLFVVFILFVTAVLIAICYAKGEPPRWRWGK